VPYWRFAARFAAAITACFDAEITVPIRGARDLAETDLITGTLFCMIEELILQNLTNFARVQNILVAVMQLLCVATYKVRIKNSKARLMADFANE
jgi:hypothetical protein